MPWRRAGGDSRAPASSPAGPPAPDGPRPRGAGGLRQGEALLLSSSPRRRSPAARARAPPRAPPPPALRAPVRLAPSDSARPPPAPGRRPQPPHAAGLRARRPPVCLRPPRSRLSARTKVGAGRPGALAWPAGRCALCSSARAAGSGSGSGSGRVGGAGTGGCSPALAPWVPGTGWRVSAPATGTGVRGRWGSRRAGRGPFRSPEKSLEELGPTNALGERVARLWRVTAPAVRVAEAGRPAPVQALRARSAVPAPRLRV